MGFIQDILDKDTDGQLKRHLFRTITFASYAMLLVALLFVGGLVWRVYSGSDLEVFGMKLSGSAREADRKSPPAARDAAGLRAPATEPGKAPPIAIQNPADVKVRMGWHALPHGNFQNCLQDAREVLATLRLVDISQNGAIVWATQRIDEQNVAQASVFCVDLNGLSAAFTTVQGFVQAPVTALGERMVQEFTAKTKGVLAATLGGAGTRTHIFSGWIPTTLADPEQCRSRANDLLTSLKASNVASSGANFVFGNVDSTRTIIICTPSGAAATVSFSAVGFNEGEAMRVRNQIGASFNAVRQP